MRELILRLIAPALLAMALPEALTAQSSKVGPPASSSTGAADSTGAVRRTAWPVVIRPDVSVSIVLVPALPVPRARAVILRRAGIEPQNVILVTARTTDADLSRAIAALYNSRRSLGDALLGDLVAHVERAEGPAQAGSRNALRAAIDLAELQRSPTSDVRGVGRYPSRTVRLGPVTR
ncbi:MAG TPA: hypothetical protein VMM18_05670 [Gemmatimonadaceae bacterium]|nr:hypothetical protein [Gemmatimonadaceae bacterium]